VALIAMSPVLAAAASDLHVSTAAAGQLRTITGLAAGTTAPVLGAVAGRAGLGRQLLAASALSRSRLDRERSGSDFRTATGSLPDTRVTSNRHTFQSGHPKPPPARSTK
jgi:hypothetical protein